MRVVLLEAPDPVGLEVPGPSGVLPLGLGYLAAALRPRHDVLIAVPSARPPGPPGEDPMDGVAGDLLAAEPDLVGVSITSGTLASGVGLVRRLAAQRPDLPIVVGGAHPWAWPRDMERFQEVGWVVQGEAEHTFARLVDALDQGSDARDIPGVWCRDEDGHLTAPAQAPALPDPGLLPPPLRGRLLWSKGLPGSFFSGVLTSRGCRFTCSYCSVPALSHRRVRFNPVPRVLREIESLRADHDVRSLFFHDSVFTVDRARTIELCRGLAEAHPRLPFTCQTRTDQVDPELLDYMAEAGCDQIMFGIETGSRATARRIHKPSSTRHLRDAVRWVEERGIRCAGFFMVGFPWEGLEDLRATRELALSLGLDTIFLFSATPLPGSPLWDMTGPMDLSSGFDFRRPWRNLTPLPDDVYREAFEAMAREFQDYNLSRMIGPGRGAMARSRRRPHRV